MAGVLVPADAAPYLEDELRGLKRTFWGKPDIEIKSRWIRLPGERSKHYTEPHGITVKDIDALVQALYRWLRGSRVRFVAGVVDKPLMQEKYSEDAHYPGAVSYTMFLQRYQKYLAKRSATGSVVFDDPAGKSPGGFEWKALLKKQHTKLKTYGCPYTKSKFPDIRTIDFVDSRTAEFVQIADLVAYNTFRQFRDYGNAWDTPGQKLPLYPHFLAILPFFDMGPQQQFAGYAVTKWPMRRKVRWTYRSSAKQAAAA